MSDCLGIPDEKTFRGVFNLVRFYRKSVRNSNNLHERCANYLIDWRFAICRKISKLQNVWLAIENWQSVTKIGRRGLLIFAILYVFGEKTYKIETSCMWIMQILWHLCNLARETCCNLQNVWLATENWQSATKVGSRDLQIRCNFIRF
jgi:hypothetical protein